MYEINEIMGSWTPGEGHLGDLEATKSTVNKEEEKAHLEFTI